MRLQRKDGRAMTLSDLKPRGYKLSDVPPDFQGMPVGEWLKKMFTSQCEAYRATKKCAEEFAKQKWERRVER
jgi:hypothetical protein